MSVYEEAYNDFAKEVNDLAKDVAMIVSKQLEVGDGPCKFYLVRVGDFETTFLRAFYDKGRMFFSVQRCNRFDSKMVLDEPNIAWDWFQQLSDKFDGRIPRGKISTYLVNPETKQRIRYKSHTLLLYVNMCKNAHIPNPVENFDRRLRVHVEQGNDSDDESNDRFEIDLD